MTIEAAITLAILIICGFVAGFFVYIFMQIFLEARRWKKDRKASPERSEDGVVTNRGLKCPHCNETDDCDEDVDEFDEPVMRCGNCGFSGDVGLFMGITAEGRQ